MRIVSEAEFAERLRDSLLAHPAAADFGSVTGPGRSGAVAAVYASHILRIPFIPFGNEAPLHLGPLLIVDTAMQTGKTIRKAVKRYEHDKPYTVVVYEEPPRVAFWYEAPKPQRYRHERRAA
jgi:hypothetical protein